MQARDAARARGGRARLIGSRQHEPQDAPFPGRTGVLAFSSRTGVIPIPDCEVPMREARADRIRTESLRSQWNDSRSGTLFAFAVVLRARSSRPRCLAGVRAASGSRCTVACFALGTAIAWSSAGRALRARRWRPCRRGSRLRAPHPGRASRRARSRSGCYAPSVGVDGRVRSGRAQATRPADQLIAFAALGPDSRAAANTLLAARVMAPAAEALARRVAPADRARVARDRRFAWTVRLLVTALVLVPAVLGALVSPLAVSLIVLALGLALGELVERAGAPGRRDAARRRARRREAAREAVTGSGQSSPKCSQRSTDSRARSRRASTPSRTRRRSSAATSASSDATRAKVVELTDAQVADVQRLSQSMSSVYSHSEKISESIQDLRIAVDESSSAVTELGAAGEQLVGDRARADSRAPTRCRRRSSARSPRSATSRPAPMCSRASRPTPRPRWSRWRPRCRT